MIPALSRLLRRVRYLLHRHRLEDDLAEEIEQHRELAQRELEASGLDPWAARHAASRALGNDLVFRSLSRDVWIWPWLQDVSQDLRFAVRALGVTPVVTGAAILSLALGIGANTAIFSLLNAILLRPLPVAQPDRLVALASGQRSNEPFPQAVWREVRDRRILDDGFAWYWTRFDTSSGGERTFLDGVVVSGGAFDALGLTPASGRLLTPGDERADRGHAAVVSYRCWQQRYAGAVDVIGRGIRLDDRTFTIVGVAPKEFTGLYVGLPFDIAIPMERVGEDSDPAAPYVFIMGRLRAGMSADGLTGALRAAQPAIRSASNPYTESPYKEEFLREPFVARSAASGVSFLARRYARPFTTLLAGCGCVLLVACGNIAMLLVARAMARRREFGVRAALGASRLRLARQLAVESLVLSAAGACLGLIVARWCASFVADRLSTQAYSVAVNMTPDWRVLAFTMAVSVLVALLFSTAPVLHVARSDVVSAIREKVSGNGSSIFAFGHATVVAQVALSVVLLACVGLFARTFVNLSQSTVGFDRNRVLVVSVDTARGQHVTTAERYRRLLAAVTNLPEVERADYSVAMPAGNSALTPWMALADGTALPQGPSGVYANRRWTGLARNPRHTGRRRAWLHTQTIELDRRSPW